MVKLRMQIQRGERSLSGNTNRALEEGRFGYKNIFHGLHLIVKREGFLALYKGYKIKYYSINAFDKGVTPKLIQGAFNTMLAFTLIEWIRKYVLLNYYNYEE